MKIFVSLLKKVLIRSNNIKFVWFCIFFFLFSPFYSYGDGVGYGFDGHNLYPVENDSIKLVSELLKMHQSGMNVKTHCWYLLKNITNNPQNLTIGFYIGDSVIYYPFFKERSDFKVYVDGKERDYQKKIIEDTTSLGFIQPIYYGIWDMSFLPNESKMVYVEQILRWFEGGMSNILSIGGRHFEYKLHLANKWAGKPERIEVYYDFGDSLPSYDTLAFGNAFSIRDTMWGVSKSIKIKPEGYNLVNDKKLVWVFENTDSIDDITINIDVFYRIPDIKSVLSELSSVYSYQLNETNKKLLTENDMKCWKNRPIEKLKEIKNRYEVYKIVLKYYPAFLRNLIYAKHGYKFKSKLWKDVFSKFDWYHQRDDFNESELNSFERKNIKFLLDYEKNIDEYLKTLE
jgi:hypothetical protein